MSILALLLLFAYNLMDLVLGLQIFVTIKILAPLMMVVLQDLLVHSHLLIVPVVTNVLYLIVIDPLPIHLMVARTKL
jgi:hypothetical protein